MDNKLTRRTVILAKSETVYGTDAAPAAADGVLCDATPEITFTGETIERDPVRDHLSPLGHVISGEQIGVKLTVEAKGGGFDAAVLAPEYAPLLLACGLRQDTPVRLPLDAEDNPAAFSVGETVSAASGASGTLVQILSDSLVLADISDGPFADEDVLTGATSAAGATVTGAPADCIGYRPTSDPDLVQACTVAFYRDGTLHKALGCLGELELDWTVNKIPKLTFALKGLWVDPGAAPLPTPELVDLIPPVVAGIGLTVGGYTPVVNALSLKLGNEVSKRTDVNAPTGLAGFRIANRKPAGSLDPEADALGTFNPFAAWRNGTAAALACGVGSAAGNRLGLFAPQAQYESVAYSDREGLVAYDLPFVCRGAAAAGDNEIRFIYS